MFDSDSLQRMMDRMQEVMRSTRADYHVTLGEMIDALRKTAPQEPVQTDIGKGIGKVASYRGYYADLAFEPIAETVASKAILEVCLDALSATFTGYKGGEFFMDKDTPLWISEYGMTSGIAIIGIDQKDGRFILQTKQVTV